MGKVKTYRCKDVIIALGNHVGSGYADDNFISIEPGGDGTTKKTGCDGEHLRALSPDDSFKVKVSLLQSSETNTFLQERYDYDQATGDGTFPIMVKDPRGGLLFSAADAWVVKPATRGFGKEGTNREWELDTGEGSLTE